MTPLSRRTFLAAGAGALLLAACGSDEPSADGQDQDGTVPEGGYQVVQFFDDGTQAAGTRQRFPFGLGDKGGVVEGDKGPRDLTATVVDDQARTVLDGVVLRRHDRDLQRPYWPLFTELPPGIYDVTLKAGAVALPSAAISVSPAQAVVVKKPGDTMPSIITPTAASPAGVDPICTAQPTCPLHDVTVADALTTTRPLVLLVGTPAYCQTGICGPVLDVLLAARGAYDGRITFLHAEVYTDDTLKTTTDAVGGLGLTFEPSLFLVKDGVITERLDTIYDRDELDDALARLVA